MKYNPSRPVDMSKQTDYKIETKRTKSWMLPTASYTDNWCTKNSMPAGLSTFFKGNLKIKI